MVSNAVLPERTLHFQLFNNIAVVDNGWRLVTAYGQPWQLYDLTRDRTETHDLAASNPEKLKHMLGLLKAHHDRPDVRFRISSGEREPCYASIYKADGKIGQGSEEAPDNPGLSLLVAKARSEGRLLTESELAVLREEAARRAAKAEAAPQRKEKRRRQ